MNASLDRFRNLSFDEFKRRAVDPSLTPSEKIGFPDAYRSGRTDAIWRELEFKLPALAGRGRRILDIGPGCGELAIRLIDQCRLREHELVLVDSQEMLDQLPLGSASTRIAGAFPEAVGNRELGKFDAICVYSVIQYVFEEGNVFEFLDRALSLLAEGGRLLLGDVPNISMRKRFFHSSRGVRFHQEFMQTDQLPEVRHLCLEEGQIDDGMLFGLMMRCRGFGYHAWIMPQGPELPMSNRREDLLIERP